MTNYQIEEIEDVKHPLLLNTILLIKSRLKEGQTPKEKEFLEAIANKNKWFPDNYHLIIVKEGGEVLAATAGYYIADINVGFINYVVVNKKFEGQGFAALLREILIKTFISDANKNKCQSPIGYLGEVEHNNPWLKTLIKKQGVVPLDVPYVQPPLFRRGKPIPLVLYFQPHPNATIKLEKAFVESVIRAVYSSVYEIANINKKAYFKKIMEKLK